MNQLHSDTNSQYTLYGTGYLPPVLPYCCRDVHQASAHHAIISKVTWRKKESQVATLSNPSHCVGDWLIADGLTLCKQQGPFPKRKASDFYVAGLAKHTNPHAYIDICEFPKMGLSMSTDSSNYLWILKCINLCQLRTQFNAKRVAKITRGEPAIQSLSHVAIQSLSHEALQATYIM